MRNMKNVRTLSALAVLLFLGSPLYSQTDTTDYEDEEDYSMYDDIDFADEAAKRYASPKIIGISPSKLIYLGYDYQGPYEMQFDGLDSTAGDTFTANSTTGIRLGCSIPVISRNSIVWQMGFNYWESRFNIDQSGDPGFGAGPVARAHLNNTFRTTGINTTLFKPLGEEQFILFQGSADLNGDYTFSDLMPLKYLKYSAAALWGKRPNDRTQWGIGLARTYRVGELNYIPIVMYNWTDVENKWGTEILFPARANVRRTINPRNMVFAGFELQGQSYRLYNDVNLRSQDLEIRRGEIRLRMEYQFSIKDFLWISAQAGYRINYRYTTDYLPDGKEIYRAFGLLKDDPYVMDNNISNPWYMNVSLNLVSP